MRTYQIKHIRRHSLGFTLIEVMITVAIIGILMAVAMPAYSNYVLRGKLVEATNNLSTLQAAMEQYYQDNRTYSDVSSSITSPCDSAAMPTLHYFTLSCTPTAGTATVAPSYVLTATGSATATSGFVYTLTNANVQASTLGSVWGGGSNACWIMSKGATC